MYGIWEKLREYVVAIRNLLLDGCLCLVVRAKQAPQGKKSVLVVKLDAIGDFILWLDSAAALRRMYPPEKYRLVLLGNSLWGELVELSQLFDEYVPLERKRFQQDICYRLNVMLSLRRRAWAFAIQPTFSRESLFGDSVIRVCGADERIGSRGDNSNQSAVAKRITDRWYTRLVPACRRPLMELKRNAEFIRALGMVGFRASIPVLTVQRFMPTELSLSDYFVVVPGANVPMRRWPVAKFAALTKLIGESVRLTVVVCGAPGEQALGMRLKDLIGAGALDYTGRTGLADYAAIIKGARFLIGNESSAVHIAAAVGTPAFCIAGGGHFGRFVPYRVEKTTSARMPVVITKTMDCFGCGWKCTHSLTKHALWPCIDHVSVEDVWEKVSGFLREEGR